ncbi:MAG: serpin family protein [Candidatus Altiarchaeota archaeon]|nr:serpin family protein [Candidatus Altiarchaeota archaeon]
MDLKIMISLTIAALVLDVFLCGCIDTQENRDNTTSSSASGVVEANNRFAFELYSEYKSQEGNVFFSPYSISSALAMTYEGARGETAEEIQAVFHFPENDSGRRQGFSAANAEINREGKAYALSTANALWAQRDFVFLPEYFKVVEEYYSGKATNLDFVLETEKSRMTINSWVEEHTNDKIKDLIPSGAITPLTRLVLTNAIYFKGTWVKQFNESLTEERDFRVGGEKTVKVDMMSMFMEDFNYTETADAQILELPYSGGELSMLILLPKDDDITSLEESLSAEKLSAWRKALREEKIDELYLPRFKFETKYFMAETLKAMGMLTAFSYEADFSGMDGKRDLYISSVIHQAFVGVNEEGTEAAAATAVIMTLSATPEPQERIIFNADHPFIFIIQQKSSGNILFLGRVSDPTAG